MFLVAGREVSFHTNFNLSTIFTSVNADVLERLLIEANYDTVETAFLTQGFRQGFDFEYQGPRQRHDRSANLPFRVGDEFQLWQKVMKEVSELRYVAPFEEVPFDFFIQSPVGLVPKAGGQTRLIFHLSYCFNELDSFNHYIPDELCSVNYQDLDCAVKTCLRWAGKSESNKPLVFLGKGDVRSAFRIILGHLKNLPWTVLKARHPVTKKTYCFVDKNLPYRASISCVLFQRFSNAIKYLIEKALGHPASVVAYLDDYLFICPTKQGCNEMVSKFIELADQIGFQVATQKMEWATTRIMFLGVLLLGDEFKLSIPEDKRLKALNAAKLMSNKRKATIHQLQQFTGFFNFICRAIFPGHAFTRRMYSKIPWLSRDGIKLKQHHHVSLDAEFRKDCLVWIQFLTGPISSTVCCPFIDFSVEKSAVELDFYTDSSANPNLGFGGYFANPWFVGACIQYLELWQ